MNRYEMPKDPVPGINLGGVKRQDQLPTPPSLNSNKIYSSFEGKKGIDFSKISGRTFMVLERKKEDQKMTKVRG